MKILHLYWDLKIGGIQTLLVQLANRQCAEHEVFVLILSNNDDSMAEFFDSRIKVTYLNKTTGSKVKAFFACLRMNLFLLCHKFDIVHFHDPQLLKYVAPFIKGNFIGTYHRDRNFFCTKRFSCITSVSKHVHDCLKGTLKTDSVIIENGIAVKRYKKKLARKNDVFKIVQIGRLEHIQKAQDLTLNVVKRVKKSGIRVSLDLIGIGPSQGYLEKMVDALNLNSEVRFLGLKEQTFLYENLCNYDLLVQPSTFEAFGLTAVEGMAAKVPVVVSSVPALKSIIDNGNCGYFFENKNEIDFFHVVKNLIEKGADEKKIEAAYERAESNYSVETMSCRYMDVYKEVFDKGCYQ